VLASPGSQKVQNCTAHSSASQCKKHQQQYHREHRHNTEDNNHDESGGVGSGWNMDNNITHNNHNENDNNNDNVQVSLTQTKATHSSAVLTSVGQRAAQSSHMSLASVDVICWSNYSVNLLPMLQLLLLLLM
jgi:hypothetical protein